jgi:hypothetical protein
VGDRPGRQTAENLSLGFDWESLQQVVGNKACFSTRSRRMPAKPIERASARRPRIKMKPLCSYDAGFFAFSSMLRESSLGCFDEVVALRCIGMVRREQPVKFIGPPSKNLLPASIGVDVQKGALILEVGILFVKLIQLHFKVPLQASGALMLSD